MRLGAKGGNNLAGKTDREMAEISKRISDNNGARRPEVRKKLSEANKIAMNRPEVRKKISESNKVAMNRPDVKQKMSEAKKGDRHPMSHKNRDKKRGQLYLFELP